MRLLRISELEMQAVRDGLRLRMQQAYRLCCRARDLGAGPETIHRASQRYIQALAMYTHIGGVDVEARRH